MEFSIFGRTFRLFEKGTQDVILPTQEVMSSQTSEPAWMVEQKKLLAEKSNMVALKDSIAHGVGITANNQSDQITPGVNPIVEAAEGGKISPTASIPPRSGGYSSPS